MRQPRRISGFLFALASGLVLANASPHPAAATPALTIDLDGGAGNDTGSAAHADFTVGWTFDVAGDVRVDALGFFDAGGNGLFRDHPVGLWDPNGTLLAMVTVPSGTAATLDAQFRWVSLGSPVLLAAGSGYSVGAEDFLPISAQFPTDRIACGGNPVGVGQICTAALDFSTSPLIGYLNGVNSDPPPPFGTPPPTFQRPTLAIGAPAGLIGPNLSITAVPEPSSALLASLGLVWLGALRRQRGR